ncbi:MAG: hypothetical protein JZU58_08750 [Curvibacter lanceolatus]|uniref:zonular occludens toxin domain-containing protein n=1 Tax=Curvibacter lanceolatus TaxID=86182 RepID=UPI0023525B57|nr:zonular occludens toxin domain-containing protein [Curvibacter lanceolatus]MBV5292431.1 hypothetical protein [Curvibacter lanceolatus]
MALSVIAGIMASGKSHQAMKYIVAPNYKKGRTIRTNIKGINEEELIKYCLEDKSVKREDLGQIIIIPDNTINKDNFYPFLTEEDNKEIINDKDSYVKAGDVLVIDEAAQFFGEIKQETLVFFTMHRHFTNDKNISCEICLLVQDVSLIHRKLMKLAKNTYLCKKLDFLGFSKSYSLKIYDGGTIKSQCLTNTKTERYDKKVFPTYSSYAKGTGKEINLDKRTNILNNWRTYVVAIFILAIPFSVYFVINNMKNRGHKKTDISQIENSSQSSTNAQQPNNNNQQNNQQIQPLQSFRIVGVMDLGIKRLVMLEDENHSLKMVQPQLCIGKGLLMTCTIDNKIISYYNKINSNNTGQKNNENKNNNQNNNSQNNH